MNYSALLTLNTLFQDFGIGKHRFGVYHKVAVLGNRIFIFDPVYMAWCVLAMKV